jgi:hypothetical protein
VKVGFYAAIFLLIGLTGSGEGKTPGAGPGLGLGAAVEVVRAAFGSGPEDDAAAGGHRQRPGDYPG